MEENEDKKGKISTRIITVVSAAKGAAKAVRGFILNYFKNTKKRKIAVLGMQGSGKSTFLQILQGKDPKDIPPTIGPEPYGSFYITLDGGIKMKISAGDDIPGTGYNEEYHDYISKNDIVFFFFKANEYLHNEEIRKDINNRLHFINKTATDEFKKDIDNDIVIIATHIDELELKDVEIKAKIKSLVLEKNYKKLFDHKFYTLNTTDQKQVHETKNDIFKR